MAINRNNPNAQVDAGRNTADETARTAHAVSEQAARAGEQVTRASTEMARRGAETASDTLKSGLDTAVQSFQRVTEQVTQVLGFAGPQAEELARQSSRNLQAVSQAGTVLAKGAQEISQEWFGLAQNRVAKNMEAMNRLVGCRSVQDFMAVQSELMRDNLQQSIENSRRVAETSMRVAEEAARTIQVQAKAGTERALRVA